MNIKKLTACVVLFAAMLTQFTAFADGIDYTDGYSNNNLTIDTDAKTVLIYRVQDDIEKSVELTDDEIVYVNQSNSGFDAATAFMLKANPSAGLYKVLLGNDGATTKGYLKIDMSLPMETAETEEYIEEYTDGDGNAVYKKGFLKTITADECSEYTTIKLVNGDSVMTWSLTDGQPSTVTSGDGDVLMGVQMYNIPDEDTAKALKIYLSKGEITNTPEVAAE